jgi:hypothetical protein
VKHLLGTLLWDLTYEHLTRLERLAKDKHSSLLPKSVNYGQKKVLYHWHQ